MQYEIDDSESQTLVTYRKRNSIKTTLTLAAVVLTLAASIANCVFSTKLYYMAKDLEARIP